MPREMWVLPDVIDPERVCITLRIPNEPHHLAAFWGNLLSLARWWNWDRDDDHTGAKVAAVWWEVFSEANSSFTGDCDVVQFRQPDDCDLEASFDGGATWQPIFNALACATGAADNQIAQGIAAGILGGGAQPGPMSPPAGTTCYNYHVILAANGKWFLPFPVNDDWTIQISNATGGANDGGIGPLWECPEGTIYTLGLCGANAGTHVGDPIDTINHMRLIMQVGMDYQDAYNLTYSVPSGTGAVDVSFQVNDTVLSDNNGSYEFDLSVCSAADPCTVPTSISGSGVVMPIGSNWQGAITVANRPDCAGTAGQEYLMAVAIPSGCTVKIHMVSNTGFTWDGGCHVIAEYNTATGAVNSTGSNPFAFLNGVCAQDYFYIRSTTPFSFVFNLTNDC